MGSKCFGKYEFVEPCVNFLEEEKFLFEGAISKFVSEHDIPLDLVLNIDQTPLLCFHAFDLKSLTAVSIKGIDDKRQITTTFTVSASGSFWPVQLVHNGKIKRYLPKYDFSNCFGVKFSLKHWSNLEKCVT